MDFAVVVCYRCMTQLCRRRNCEVYASWKCIYVKTDTYDEYNNKIAKSRHTLTQHSHPYRTKVYIAKSKHKIIIDAENCCDKAKHSRLIHSTPYSNKRGNVIDFIVFKLHILYILFMI